MVEKDTMKSFCTPENIGQEIAADSRKYCGNQV
jgi:hypothetical protein